MRKYLFVISLALLISLLMGDKASAMGPEDKEIFFVEEDRVHFLPESSYDKIKITPTWIVIHTDDQPGRDASEWKTSVTWNGLSGREEGGRSVHFAVGVDGIVQMLPMYQHMVMQGRASQKDAYSIQIEMCGRDYNKVVEGTADREMKEAVELITGKTTSLVVKLMVAYKIPLGNIEGHYMQPGSGKTDPGDKYFEQIFLPLLRDKLLKNSKKNIPVRAK